jgi:hypothetical protein
MNRNYTFRCDDQPHSEEHLLFPAVPYEVARNYPRLTSTNNYTVIHEGKEVLKITGSKPFGMIHQKIEEYFLMLERKEKVENI